MDPENDFEIVECICAWYDLLGFGQPLVDSNWNLNDERCKNQLRRIESMHFGITNFFSATHGTITFNLNDGVISNLDMERTTPGFKSRLIMALDDLVLEFERLNTRDSRSGFPGMRGILTFGHRYNYTDTESTVMVTNGRTIAYHPKVFQMNTAFSKAYIMESSGSKAGISGNHLYIDEFLLDAIESFLLTDNDDSDKFIVEKNLNVDGVDCFYSIQKNDDIFLKLEFDSVVKYNNKGISTNLYRFIKRISLQDQLANEQEYRRAQRYAQMERDEE